MVRKKVDNRLRVMIENGVANRHRSMFVIVGDRGRDQVVILHHMLSKAVVKARPTVLWCYKKELGFSSHRKKRMRQLQKKIRTGKLDMKEDDPFELFIAATNIRYCYYAETHKILGNTYGMCVLQDFEALSPNLLARTVETVEGGGLVVLLLQSMDSLRQLYTLSMDVHARFRTQAHQDVVGRFNERFILSLASCKNCLVIDDQLNVLPVSSQALNITPVQPRPVDKDMTPSEEELRDLKASLQDTQPLGVLVSCCRTLDQGKALLKFIEAISEKTLRSTVAMTAARGRGKSAALGLAMASAVAFGYSNIFVTAPSPENLKTMFDFVFKGFDALGYQEHLDYELVQSINPEFNKAIVRVNIFREHRQTIQYIQPTDAAKLSQAELVCIDEAAAIPLPLVKSLMGPYLVFMASTINGYEGTGRSLSLKLIQQLREQSAGIGASNKAQTEGHVTASSSSGRVLHEVTLTESIRYGPEDQVERWLYDVLCLDAANVPRISSGCPLPEACELYYVNRDTLFSYHKASEQFLQRLMGLYVSSHYKNTPNDLQLLSDAPAHHVFCLLGPVNPTQNSLPEILVVLQVCLEGEISKASVMSSLQRGKRAAGDLIPWTVSQQFQDHDFPTLSGARIVRIATHPDYQGMGYGGRALNLLQQYYEGRFPSVSESDTHVLESAPTLDKEHVNLLEEKIAPRKNLPPLLLKLSEREPEALQYLGVSFGLTEQLLKFWKKSGYVPVYLRQTANELTGEHSCIMLRLLNAATVEEEEMEEGAEELKSAHKHTWLAEYWTDFSRRFQSLLGYQFRSFPPSMAMSVLQQRQFKTKKQDVSPAMLSGFLTQYDMKRLQLYSQNMVDYHLIMDLLPTLARLYFQHHLNISLSTVQEAILLTLGHQHKTVDEISKELDLPVAQVLGLFNRTMRKVSQCLDGIEERSLGTEMPEQKQISLEALPVSMDQELDEAALLVESKQKSELAKLKGVDLEQYSIRGSEDDWAQALSAAKSKGIVSIKGSEMKRKTEDTAWSEKSSSKQKKHKKNKQKK